MQSYVLGATAELAEAAADYVNVVATAELDLSRPWAGCRVFALLEHEVQQTVLQRAFRKARLWTHIYLSVWKGCRVASCGRQHYLH
jgi:hypothetical protein